MKFFGKNTILKNTTLYTIGNVLPSVLSFVLLPFYTHYLNPSSYGIIQSMELLKSFLVIFMSLGLRNAINRLSFEYTEEQKKYFYGTILITISISSLILVISNIFIISDKLNMIFESIPFYPFYVYTIIISAIQAFSFLPLAYFVVEQKVNHFIFFSVGQFLVDALLKIYFISFRHMGVEGYLLSTLISLSFFIPSYLIVMRKDVKLKFNFQYFKDSISYSLPLIPVSLSSLIMNLSDRVFIERYFHLHELGIYSMGYKIAGVILILTSAFRLAYDPIYFRVMKTKNNNLEFEKNKLKIKSYNTLYALMIILVGLLIILYSREVVVLLLDDKYYQSYLIIPIITISYIVGKIGEIDNLTIYQAKKTKLMMNIILSSALLNIILNFLFIRSYGMYGAAVATLISTLFLNQIRRYFTKQIMQIGFYFKPISISGVVLLVSTIVSYKLILDNLVISIFIKLFLVIISMLVVFLANKKFILETIKSLS